MTKPVTKARVAIAAKTLQNADAAARACREAGLPYFAACALLEQETGGKNEWGHDAGGVFSGFPGPVNADTFAAFLWEVQHNHRTSNGVGPCQITYPGFFPDMEKRGLRPWVPEENMRYGFELLAKQYAAHGKSWVAAGEAYNGSRTYGVDLDHKVTEWRKRLGV